jgi:RNA polymerase sigma-70 factor (ECF subfamily)
VRIGFLWVEKNICKEKIIKTASRAQGFSKNRGKMPKSAKKGSPDKDIGFHPILGHNKAQRCTLLRMTNMTASGDRPTDAQLLRDYERGNVQAFDELVARYKGALHGYLRSMTGNTADAEDIFQETWLRVIRNSRSFRSGAFNAWLWCIARNLLIDRLRRLRPTVSLNDESGEGSALGDSLAATAPDPATQMATEDLARLIAAAVAELPPDLRDMFLLRTQTGLSFAEIAKMRKVPLNTALGRMHYAMQHMRRKLGPVWATRQAENDLDGNKGKKP